SNDESFVLKSAVEIGRETGDYVWPMPLAKEYDYYLKSDTADFNNMSSSPFGGSITAAVFLNKFIDHHIKWIHIDMGNTVRPWKIEDHQSEGAAGYGVKLLRDRKSTRLNSSHVSISYAVFCLKKKKR